MLCNGVDFKEFFLKMEVERVKNNYCGGLVYSDFGEELCYS